MRILFYSVSLMLIAARLAQADLVNAKCERTIELTSGVVHINHVITVENKAGGSVAKSYLFVVEPANAKNLAFIGAKVTTKKEKKS